MPQEKKSSSKATTIRDVAEAASVSPATVSLVLRHSSQISKATTERVRREIERLGYRPNPLVSALMRNRGRKGSGPMRGLPVPFILAKPAAEDGSGSHPFDAWFAGAAARAREMGFALEQILWNPDEMSAESLQEEMQEKRLPGFLLAGMSEGNAMRKIDWGRMVAVEVGQMLDSPRLHRVRTAVFDATVKAIENCVDSGYGRIGVCMGEFDGRHLGSHVTGAFLLMRKRFPGLLLERVFQGSLNDGAVASWLDEAKPDAIIDAGNGQSVRRLLDAGAHGDIGLAALHITAPDSSVSGFFHHSAKMGEQAIDMLYRAMERNEVGVPACPMDFTFNGVWNPGETLRRG